MDTNQIINSFGGTTETAKLCRITKGAVSQWRSRGIPKGWLAFLQQMNPDLFHDDETTKKDASDVVSS